jgi:NAD(P)-dependent dehydrogenase (short-subunit alcohol dehydrogenase family)
MAAKKTQSRPKRKSTAHARTPALGELRLLGNVAVVTGGSRGIGQAIARALANEGCAVIIAGRDRATLEESASRISKKVRGRGKIVPLVCDVRDAEAVALLFAKVKQRFRRVDILVNNAGISQEPTSVEETSPELWREIVEINLTGIFLCSRAALPLMQRGATIINNLSAAAKQIFPKFAAYTAAKTGAYGFTLSLREELIPRGIRVTGLMPGATDMWNQIMPNAPRERMMSRESTAQAVLYAVLLPPVANLSELLLIPTGGAV